MKYKSLFSYHKRQRRGIFLLLLLLIIGIVVRFYWPFQQQEPAYLNRLPQFEAKLDSLAAIKIEASKPKLYPFNPNFINEGKAYTIGMSVEEMERLHRFRESGKWINSKNDFKRVTGVSQQWLDSISPFFKFPDWVTNPKPRPQFQNTYTTVVKSYAQKIDLNIATQEQLQEVRGIGPAYSQRIVKYRERIGGFQHISQLQDVYGLESQVIEKIKQDFIVKTPPFTSKINLSTATAYDLEHIPYFDFRMAKRITDQRTLREGFDSWEELMKVREFPIPKIEQIKLYLTLN